MSTFLSPKTLARLLKKSDLRVLEVTDPGSGRPWVDLSGALRVGGTAGTSIPYMPNPSPSEDVLTAFDGLGGLKEAPRVPGSTNLNAALGIGIGHKTFPYVHLQSDSGAGGLLVRGPLEYEYAPITGERIYGRESLPTQPTFSFVESPTTGMYSPATSEVALSTNGVKRLHVSSAGLVGINALPSGAGLVVSPPSGSTLPVIHGKAVETSNKLIKLDNSASAEMFAVQFDGRVSSKGGYATYAKIGTPSISDIPLNHSKVYYDNNGDHWGLYVNSDGTIVEITSHGLALLRANNLSDLTNVSDARDNLGLGTAAVEDVGYFATAAQGALADSALQPADIDTLAELNAIITDATLIDTTDPRLSDARTPLAHTHPISDVTALQTTLDAKADLVGGVVPTSQIPAIAITEFLGEVANEAAMLALSGEEGDWAIRTDLGTSWVLVGPDPSDLGDWQELAYPGAPVTSVNGQTGTVVLDYGDVGAASAAQGTLADGSMQRDGLNIVSATSKFRIRGDDLASDVFTIDENGVVNILDGSGTVLLHNTSKLLLNMARVGSARVEVGTTTETSVGLVTDKPSARFYDKTRDMSIYRDLEAYQEDSTVVGAILVRLPKGFVGSFLTVRIQGFEYRSFASSWEVVLSGYLYALGGNWINATVQSHGCPPFTGVRFAYDGTRAVLVLGEETTSWSYPNIQIKEVTADFGSQTAWGTGWTITRYETLPSLTQVLSRTLTTRTPIGSQTTPGISVGRTNTGLFGYDTAGEELGVSVQGLSRAMFATEGVILSGADDSTTALQVRDNTGTTYVRADLLDSSLKLENGMGIDVAGDTVLRGAIKNDLGASGTAGQVLTATASNFEWKAPGDLGLDHGGLAGLGDNDHPQYALLAGANFTGSLTVSSNTVWHAGNDGTGSGLDADTLDGVQGANFLRSDVADTAAGKITFSTGLARSAYNVGHLEGGYSNLGASLFQSNPIFTLGSGFNPGTTTLGDMYGVGYAYGSSSFLSTLTSPSAAAWGLYVASAGVAKVFLDGSGGTIRSTGQHYVGSNVVWNAGNDGAGTGMDSDLLDGQHGAYYLDPANLSAVVPVTKGGTGVATLPANKVLFGNGTSALVTDTLFHFDPADDRLGVGTATPIATVDLVADFTTATPLRVSRTGGLGLSFFPLDYEASIAAGAFFGDSGWEHDNPLTTDSVVLALVPNAGVEWYSSSDSTASWNDATSVILWNKPGIFKRPIQATAIGTNSYIGDGLGVGHATAIDAKLHVISAAVDIAKLERTGVGAGAALLFENGDADQGRVWLDGSGDMRIDVGGTISTDTKLTVTAAGDLHIAGGFKDTSVSLGTSGQMLTSTGTGTSWEDAPVVISDHGGLSGLGDNDHPQYVQRNTSNVVDASNTFFLGTASGTSGPGIQMGSDGYARIRTASGTTLLEANGRVLSNWNMITSVLFQGQWEGSAASPAYSWTSDPNTGLFRPAADQLAVSTGGTERLRVTATGVGIGLTPTVPLDVSGAAKFGSARVTGAIYDSTNSAGTSGQVLTTTGTTTAWSTPSTDASTLDGIDSLSFLRSDVADTAAGKITFSTGLARSAHNVGHLEGGYNNLGNNSTYTNPIYTIGSGYNPLPTTLDNMYGVGYAYGTVPFLSNLTTPNANRWGFYVAAVGEATIFLEGTEGTIRSVGQHYVGSNVVWNAGNDGAGTGMDSDLLDGQHGAYYLDPANLSAVVPVTKGGTGLATLTADKLLFGNGTSAVAQDTLLHFNPTTKRLGLGTITPLAALDLKPFGSSFNTTLRTQADSGPGFSVTPYPGGVLLGTGIRVDGGVWTHDNGLSEYSSILELTPQFGARWFATSANSTSFDVVAAPLWDSSGYFKRAFKVDDISTHSYVSGLMGIGLSTTPEARLHVVTATDDAIKIKRANAGQAVAILLENGDADKARVWLDATGDLRFDVGGTISTDTKMIVDSSGNVGINETDPTQRLHVAGNARVTGAIYDSSNSAGTSGQVLTTTGAATAWSTPSTDASTLDGIDSTSFLRSDVADTAAGKITFTTGLARSAHNVGHLEGGHVTISDASLYTSPIYTIGSAYNPNTTTLGSMYGLGFAYGSASFLSGLNTPGASGWGTYVAAAGVARIFLDATGGTVRSTGQHYVNNQVVWNAGNDGIGSGLDADLVQGYDIEDVINQTVRVGSTTSAPAGWYTIATNNGNRAGARFVIVDKTSGRHQQTVFYASHQYGANSSNCITVLSHSVYNPGGEPVTHLRIKDAGTYDGCVLQAYTSVTSTDCKVYITGDNVNVGGWKVRDFIPDATTPPDVSNYGIMEARSEVALTQISYGGMISTGDIYSGGPTSQYRNLTTADGIINNVEDDEIAFGSSGDLIGSPSLTYTGSAGLSLGYKSESVAGSYSEKRMTVYPPYHSGGPFALLAVDEPAYASLQWTYGGAARAAMRHDGHLAVGHGVPTTALNVRSPTEAPIVRVQNDGGSSQVPALQLYRDGSTYSELGYNSSDALGSQGLHLQDVRESANAAVSLGTRGDKTLWVVEDTVGVGTYSTLAGLHVAKPSAAGRVLYVEQTDNSPSSGAYAFQVNSSIHDTNVSAAGAMAVDVLGLRAMTIDGLGRTALGHATPTEMLHISGEAHPSIKLESTSSSAYYTVLANNYSSGQAFAINVGGSIVFESASQGNQSVKVGGPQSKVEFRSADREIHWSTDSVNRMSIVSGRLGIAQTSPLYKLDVTGNARFTDDVIAANNLLLGDWPQNDSYQGVFLSDAASTEEYMLMSNGIDTFVGAPLDGDIYLRPNRNNNTYQLTVREDTWPTVGNPGYTIWHAGNDGVGSGLDADLLDGLDAGEYRPNLLKTYQWVPGSGGLASWTQNGTGNSRVISKDPEGQYACIWKAESTDEVSGSDGGWTTTISNLDNEKTYMSVVYVRRTSTPDSGNFYHGCYGVSSTNLNGSANTNPYHVIMSVASLPKDVWCVSIAYIRPYSEVGTTTSVHSGVYRLDTGVKVSSSTDFRFDAGVTTQTHRAFLFYASTSGVVLELSRPGFYEVNEAAPSINTLMGNVISVVGDARYSQWNSGNDGASSGLDADLLDGEEGSYYLSLSNVTGVSPGKVAFGAAGTGLTYDTSLHWDSVNNLLGVGLDTPLATLDVLSDTTRSSIRSRRDLGVGFAVLPWSTSVLIGAGVRYSGGTWVHDNTNSANSVMMDMVPGSGMRWYASSDSSASWDLASGVLLWDTGGYYRRPIRAGSAGVASYIYDSLGIGLTSAPAAKLHVYSTVADVAKLERSGSGGGAALLFENGDDDQGRVWLDGSGNMRIDVGSTISTDTKLTLTAAGDITWTGTRANNYTRTYPIYAAGTTGSAGSGAPRVLVNNTAASVPTARGLQLTIVNAETQAVVSSTVYDTYGSTVSSDALAAAIEGVVYPQIGILTSYDAWRNNLTSALIVAARRAGLDKLASCGSGLDKRPYAAAFLGTEDLTVTPNRTRVERMNGSVAEAVFAAISFEVVYSAYGVAFKGDTDPPSCLFSPDRSREAPIVAVRDGRVGVNFPIPEAPLHVQAEAALGVRLKSVNSGYWDILPSYSYTDADLTFRPNLAAAANCVRFSALGQVSVGYLDTTSSGPKLSVRGAVAINSNAAHPSSMLAVNSDLGDTGDSAITALYPAGGGLADTEFSALANRSSLWHAAYVKQGSANRGLTVDGKTQLIGELELDGAVRDTGGSVGTSGQILSSTVTGVDWIDAPSGGVTATDNQTNASFAVPFLSAATGSVSVHTDASQFAYNPSTASLTVLGDIYASSTSRVGRVARSGASLYNPASGVLVETDMLASNNTMFMMSFRQNTYNSTKGSGELLWQGYNYTTSGTVIQASAVGVGGGNFTNITVFYKDGVIWFWWPTASNFQTYTDFKIMAAGGYNRVVSVTDAAMPVSGVTSAVTTTPYKSWTSLNHGSGSGLDADKLDGIDSLSFLRSDADDTAANKITFSTGLARSDYHIGHLEGGYSNIGPSTLTTNPIFTIGSAYNPSSTTLGNMYGIGFTYGTASFLSSLTTPSNVAWGMYVAADGDARIFLDGTGGTIRSLGQHYVGSNVVWNAGNDGAGTGLDADYLDGQHGAYYLDLANTTGVLPLTRGGTGVTSLPAAQVPFGNSGGTAHDSDSSFRWDNTAKALIIGPTAATGVAVDGATISGYGGIWLGQASRTALNYSMIGNYQGTAFNAPSGTFLSFRLNNSEKMKVHSTGKISLGTGATPTKTVDIIGSLYISGGIGFRSGSSDPTSGDITTDEAAIYENTTTAEVGLWANRDGVVKNLTPDPARVLGINNQSGTTYTLVLADAGYYVRFTNASPVTVTVPTNASVAIPVRTVITLRQVGAGQISIVGAGGVTLNGKNKTPEQHQAIQIIKVGTNEWDIEGGVD